MPDDATPTVSGDIKIPLAEVAVAIEDPTDTFCGQCRPASVPMAWDPQYGYLCPRHGDGRPRT